MKLIEYNVPTFTRDNPEPVLERRQGFRIWLELGTKSGRKRAFVLQRDPLDRPSMLVDYASGYHVAKLGPLMLERYVRHPSAYRERLCDWRWQAQLWLDAACERQGVDTVLLKLNSVPVVNG